MELMEEVTTIQQVTGDINNVCALKAQIMLNLSLDSPLIELNTALCCNVKVHCNANATVSNYEAKCIIVCHIHNKKQFNKRFKTQTYNFKKY